MKLQTKTAGIIATAAVFFMFDRAAKRLFSGLWRLADFSFFGGRLSLKLSINRGIAFGLPLPISFALAFTAGSLVFLVWLAWRSWRQADWLSFIAFACIIAGSFSNFFDRLASAGVIDYIQVRGLTAFNLADAMIVIGSAVALSRSFPSAKRAKPAVEPDC